MSTLDIHVLFNLQQLRMPNYIKEKMIRSLFSESTFIVILYVSISILHFKKLTRLKSKKCVILVMNRIIFILHVSNNYHFLFYDFYDDDFRKTKVY